jgi:Flp pilus assembly protein TadG
MTRGVTARLRARCRQVRQAPDRGSGIAAYLVAMAVVLFAFAGLVLDGGAALTARGQAADTAQQAARAGADALDVGSLRSGVLRADSAAAVAAAEAVLSAAGVEGQVDVAGSQVTVTAHVTRPTAILSMVGVGEVGGTATYSAFPLHGTTTGARS